MKYVLIILLVLVIFIVSVAFGAHNDQVVTCNYLLAQSQFRMSTMLISLFAASFVIDWVVCGLFWLRMHVAALMRVERKSKARTAACAGGDGSNRPRQYPGVASKE
ncbi:MAG: Lipopolysaccharide assembly protein A [Sodalis sp.]|nr:MAG: Lipopolysaccharide assembly protein A [Sodalis sp.]